MPYSTNTLPKELVLYVFYNIKNWPDRTQFTLASKYHYSCILKSVSLRKVDIEETNLLKIKLARELTFSPRYRLSHLANRVIKLLYIGNNLKTIDAAKVVFAKSDIREILKAIGSRKSQPEIIVSAGNYGQWIGQLDNQKSRAGSVKVSCAILDDDELDISKASQQTSKLDSYFEALHYTKCAYKKRPKEDIITENVDDVALALGSYFAGAIVCFDKIKILITSLDVFFHVEDLDDCAYTNKWLNENVFAKLHLKSEKGNNFFELSIVVDGCIELLAVGGLCVINGGSVEPFLGSSVKPLNRAKILDSDNITSNIFVPARKKETVRSERLLRQYYKRDACNAWSFHLKDTYDAAFYPINLLHANSHPSVSSVQLSLNSALLWMYSRRVANQTLLTNAFQSISGSSFMKKQLKLTTFDGDSFQQLYDAMAIDGKWKTIIGIASDLERAMVSFTADKKTTAINRKVVLQIVNSGYMSALSRKNDENCVAFKSKISK